MRGISSERGLSPRDETTIHMPKLSKRIVRWLVSSAGVGALMAVQMAPLWSIRILPVKVAGDVIPLPALVFGYTAIVLPILLIWAKLAEHFAWSVRRLLGVALALSIGFGFCVGLFLSFQDRGITNVPAPLLGCAAGLLQLALWMSLVVLPELVSKNERREIEMKALQQQAERLSVEAHWLSLRNKLEPHFLLNTLNTIGGLISIKPDVARSLLNTLGDLLRDALTIDTNSRSVRMEIAWLRRYAEILEIRHGERLHFEWNIAPEVEQEMIPHLLLQPLIENAVQHGALHRPRGRVRIEITRIEEGEHRGWVRCLVEDNGKGAPAEAFTRPGRIGLVSVQQRSHLLHPESTLRIVSNDTGTTISVDLPGKDLSSI